MKGGKKKTAHILSPNGNEPFDFDAALYFLADEGHYLFRLRQPNGGFATKYLRHRDVKAAFHGKETDTEWIDSGVKRFGANKSGDWFVFYMPRVRRIVPFLVRNEIQELDVPLPATVMVAAAGIHFIFALKGKDFNPDGRLCVSPFPNVEESGQICWGTSFLPPIHQRNARDTWEAFFGSVFNRHTDENKIKGIPGSCIPYWISLARGTSRVFPERKLLETQQILSRFLENRI